MTRSRVNDKDQERYRKLLLARREELRAKLGQAPAPAASAGDPAGDLIDRASADTEAESEIRRRQNEGRVLRAIQEALARMHAGTFGTCETCGKAIARARLDAVPWTRLCRQCKEHRQTAA